MEKEKRLKKTYMCNQKSARWAATCMLFVWLDVPAHWAVYKEHMV